MKKILNWRDTLFTICILICILFLYNYINFFGAFWLGIMSGGIIFTAFIEPIIKRFNPRSSVPQIEVAKDEDDMAFLARFVTDVSSLSKKGILNEAELSYPLDTVSEAIERVNLIPDMPIDVQIAVKACDAYVKVFKMKREQKS